MFLFAQQKSQGKGNITILSLMAHFAGIYESMINCRSGVFMCWAHMLHVTSNWNKKNFCVSNGIANFPEPNESARRCNMEAF